jgi:hypothetical protein
MIVNKFLMKRDLATARLDKDSDEAVDIIKSD